MPHACCSASARRAATWPASTPTAPPSTRASSTRTCRTSGRSWPRRSLACGHVAGVPCTPFDDATGAEALLARGLAPPDAGDLDARPDLRALTAQRRSAEAALQLARNRRIPDPTFRLGYLRDQFTISGNQLNSLFAGVSVPLPVFDHGQADAMEAAAAGEAAGRAHDLLRAQAEREIGALVAQAREAADRREALESSSLPLARQLVDTLQSAVQRGGASLGELLLARRTLGELLLAAADVRFLSFRLASEIGRAGALGPPAPVDLATRHAASRRSHTMMPVHSVSPVPEPLPRHTRVPGAARQSWSPRCSRWQGS